MLWVKQFYKWLCQLILWLSEYYHNHRLIRKSKFQLPPKEVLVQIFGYCGLSQRRNIQLTSTYFNILVLWDQYFLSLDYYDRHLAYCLYDGPSIDSLFNKINFKYLFEQEQYHTHPSDLKKILENGGFDWNQLFLNFCKIGNYPCVKLLLEDGHVNNSTKTNGLQLASQNGHHQCVDLLLKDDQVTPIGITSASANGYYQCVDLFLKDGLPGGTHAGFGANPQNCIYQVCQNGHYKCLELLLQDGRDDPSTMNSYCFIHANRYGYYQCVELLLKDNRIDPTSHNNEAIKETSENGHHRCVELLLRDGRVDPCDQDNVAIRFAIKNGHHRCAKLLLKDLRLSEYRKKNYLNLKIMKLIYNFFNKLINKFPLLPILPFL